MLSHQKIEKITNGYAILQVQHEMKIVGVEKDLAAATTVAEKTGNLGYPVVVLPIPIAFIPQGQAWGTPNYK